MKNKTKKLKLDKWTDILFISPWIIGFVVFLLGPMLFSLGVSFTKWDYMTNMKFIGLDNYIKIFTNDRQVFPAVMKTLKFTFFAVPLQIGIGLLVAQVFNTKLKGVKIYRALVYLPCVISGAVHGMLWNNILHKDFGVFNFFTDKLGLERIGWLTDPSIAMNTIILTSIWAVGVPMIMFLSAMQNISVNYYEAAEIDGASSIKKFTKITLPLITPNILFVLILQLISSFTVMAQVLVLTNGGPAKSTYIYSLYVYENAFKYMKMGYASALSWVMFVIIMTVTILIFWSSKYWVYYEENRGGM